MYSFREARNFLSPMLGQRNILVENVLGGSVCTCIMAQRILYRVWIMYSVGADSVDQHLGGPDQYWYTSTYAFPFPPSAPISFYICMRACICVCLCMFVYLEYIHVCLPHLFVQPCLDITWSLAIISFSLFFSFFFLFYDMIFKRDTYIIVSRETSDTYNNWLDGCYVNLYVTSFSQTVLSRDDWNQL